MTFFFFLVVGFTLYFFFSPSPSLFCGPQPSGRPTGLSYNSALLPVVFSQAQLEVGGNVCNWRHPPELVGILPENMSEHPLETRALCQGSGPSTQYSEQEKPPWGSLTGACPQPLQGDCPVRLRGDVERGGAGRRTAQRPGGCPPGVLPCSPLPQLWASAVMVLGWVHRCTPETGGPRRAWFWVLFSGHAVIVSVESLSLQTGIGGQITGALPGFASFQQTLVRVSGFGGGGAPPFPSWQTESQLGPVCHSHNRCPPRAWGLRRPAVQLRRRQMLKRAPA